jgi:hypothetical protein
MSAWPTPGATAARFADPVAARSGGRDPEEYAHHTDDRSHQAEQGRDGADHGQPGEPARELVALLRFLLLEHQAEGLQLREAETFALGGAFAQGARAQLAEEVDALAEDPSVGRVG